MNNSSDKRRSQKDSTQPSSQTTQSSDASLEILRQNHSIRREGRTVRILLVEDDITDAALIKELLHVVEDFKFISTHVKTLAMAISASETQRVDCILLDMNLPDSQGTDTYRIMRRHALDTPIIILTGQPDREVMMESLRLGADNYLIKGSCDGNRIAIAVLSALRNYAYDPSND